MTHNTEVEEVVEYIGDLLQTGEYRKAVTTLHHQLQKAREEERERIYTAVDDVASVVLVAEIKTGDKDEILGMLRSITL